MYPVVDSPRTWETILAESGPGRLCRGVCLLYIVRSIHRGVHLHPCCRSRYTWCFTLLVIGLCYGKGHKAKFFLSYSRRTWGGKSQVEVKPQVLERLEGAYGGSPLWESHLEKVLRWISTVWHHVIVAYCVVVLFLCFHRF